MDEWREKERDRQTERGEIERDEIERERGRK